MHNRARPGGVVPRGGRRPGAGAPRGNINRMVDGERSRQLRAWVRAMTSYPEGRRLLHILMQIDPHELFSHSE